MRQISQLKEKKYIKIIALLILSIGFCSAFLLSFNKFAWADDYSFQMMLKNNNLFEWAWERYLTFDGRHLTIWGLIQGFNIKYLPLQLTIALYFIVFAFGIAIIFKQLFFTNITNKQNAIISILTIILSFLIIYRAHAFETIYWSVGGLYSLILGGFACWFYLLGKIEFTKERYFFKMAFYILSLLIGSSTQNLSVAILFILLFKIIIEKKWKNSQLQIGFLLVLAGTLIISLAPGNTSRGLNVNSIDFSILGLINNFTSLNIQYINLSRSSIIISFPIALLLYKSGNISNSKNNFKNAILFLGAALSTVLPFIILPEGLASNRTAIYFQLFFSLSLIYFYLIIIQYITNKIALHKLFYQLNAGLIITCVSIVPVFNFVNSFKLKNEYKNREMMIINNSDKSTLSISIIRPSLDIYNYLNYFKDITEDPNFWRNQAFAEYYGYKTAVSYEKK